ncbi:DUF4232 domain-containing protein [Chelativorans sp. M5D2P16]|uniref:DUF4232 domain-containing protein n=1 Tax=Chelativorans sp. M5D2P16 TaxID=3095678 RepID=UPI002ACAEB19|nr:DUF4232 domain-containing protein [Chelativorans sp. M5D2P16]MDZ5696285.1 DUF4232 domain-containing protein [Chelativorans sp. M5D2P16]
MRISRFFACLVAILAALWSFAAPAQSFDCGKAETNTEWAICNTPELAKLDEELAKTYHQLLGSVEEGSALARKYKELQVSWIHGSRDRCGGNVDCLIQAYNAISTVLPALSLNSPANPAQQPGYPFVPDCGASAQKENGAGVTDGYSKADDYNKTVCSSRKLLDAVRQIDQIAGALSPKLPARWRAAFEAQQSAFPSTPYMCPPETKLQECIEEAVQQRLEDVKSLADLMENPVVNCTPSDIRVTSSQFGDAGMSKRLDVYFFTYDGAGACVLRGYPAIAVLDGGGDTQPDNAEYSGSTYFSRVPEPPLPVVLSPKNRTAWFALNTANACDPSAGPLKVKVALPHSQRWLETLEFPYANCPGVVVTPIAAISTLLSSI